MRWSLCDHHGSILCVVPKNEGFGGGIGRAVRRDGTLLTARETEPIVHHTKFSLLLGVTTGTVAIRSTGPAHRMQTYCERRRRLCPYARNERKVLLPT